MAKLQKRLFSSNNDEFCINQTFIRKKNGPKRNGQQNDKLAQFIIDCPFLYEKTRLTSDKASSLLKKVSGALSLQTTVFNIHIQEC